MACNLFRELNIPLKLSPILHCDNVSATYLVSNPILLAHTKHIEIGYHFLRERVILGYSRIIFVPSEQQIADVFTKGLSAARFKILRHKLTVLPCSPISLKGGVNDSE